MFKINLSILLFSLYTLGNVYAQVNLVPNPSFEEYDSIQTNPDSSNAMFYYFPKFWFVPVSCGFSYYFNSKLNNIDTMGSGAGISPYGVPQNPWSYTVPYKGEAQAAVAPFVLSENQDYRNYLEVELSQQLKKGHNYCVSFYVSLADSSYIAIDQIGAYFSINPIYNYNPQHILPCYILQTPQIVSPVGTYFNLRNQWQRISGIFTAIGGEFYMTIGNFKTDSVTNYFWLPDESNYDAGSSYLIDMVSVIECDSNIRNAEAVNDVTICLGDSVRLGACDSSDGYEFVWLPSEGLSDSVVQCPYAKPSQTTTYVLQQSYYSSYITTDEVTITVIDCSQLEELDNVFYIPNIFSPNKDGQNDKLYVRGQEIESLHFFVYNRWGNLVFESKDINEGWDGTQLGKPCETGVYVYRAEVMFKNGETVVKRGDVTLVR